MSLKSTNFVVCTKSGPYCIFLIEQTVLNHRIQMRRNTSKNVNWQQFLLGGHFKKLTTSCIVKTRLKLTFLSFDLGHLKFCN